MNLAKFMKKPRSRRKTGVFGDGRKRVNSWFTNLPLRAKLTCWGMVAKHVRGDLCFGYFLRMRHFYNTRFCMVLEVFWDVCARIP